MDAKKRAASNINAHLEQIRAKTQSRYRKLALSMVAPGDHKPMVYPSLAPGLAGAAVFPLVVEVTGATVGSSFGVIASPSENPLLISHTAAVAESSNTINSHWQYLASTPVEANADRGCAIESATVDGRTALPVSSAAGATVTFGISYVNGKSAAVSYDLYLYNGAAWTIAFTSAISRGFSATTVGVAIPNTTTHYSVGVRPIAPDTSFTGILDAFLTPTAGTLTCQSGGNQNVFDSYSPDWLPLLASVERFRITSMSVLATFEGSTLNNQGSIAVCDAERNLEMTSDWYSTVASQPIDMYRGRLSEGAHWHYVPTDPSQYLMSATFPDPATVPHMYLGVNGMSTSTESVLRIEVHIGINFYSTEPQYSMSVPPPWHEFGVLLNALRTAIPLVTSNDNHFKKLDQVVKALPGLVNRGATAMITLSDLASILGAAAGQPQVVASSRAVNAAARTVKRQTKGKTKA